MSWRERAKADIAKDDAYLRELQHGRQYAAQTRLVSLIEVSVNTAIGFLVSAAAWPFVAYVMGYPYTVGHTVAVTSFYTVLSVARGYVIRRFFAKDLHLAAVRWARSLGRERCR